MTSPMQIGTSLHKHISHITKHGFQSTVHLEKLPPSENKMSRGYMRFHVTDRGACIFTSDTLFVTVHWKQTVKLHYKLKKKKEKKTELQQS
jgi:hypothetical protein